MMNKQTVLITGSNRGIGLGLVREFIKKNYSVIATCRQPDNAKELVKLKNQKQDLVIEKLDVTLPSDFETLSNKYKNIPIDVLINNAGIFPEDHSRAGIASCPSSSVLNAFQVNTLGPYLAIQTFQTNLLKSRNPRIINLSSLMGALSAAAGYGYSYRISKAGLNMLTCTFAAENKKIITVSLRPGWVKTAMGGKNANMDVEESAIKLFNIIENLEAIDSGHFYDIEKNICSW